MVLVFSLEELQSLAFAVLPLDHCILRRFVDGLGSFCFDRILARILLSSRQIGEAVSMLEALLLRCGSVVALVVLPGPEDARGLHGSSLLGAEDALHHYASLHIERPAVVADPVVVWNFVDAIAFLVYRYVAIAAKNDKIFVLVVSVVADGTLGVLLDD